MSARVTLSAGEARALDARFQRFHLPEPVWLPEGALATSVIVGRVDGRVRAYANVCRHYPFPLDQGGSGVMSPDGQLLLCHTHGALYRPDDGLCLEGPCEGARLFEARVEDAGDGLVVILG
jgi:nitrite reductase/ring-hydroxylating ferredoxin subunit